MHAAVAILHLVTVSTIVLLPLTHPHATCRQQNKALSVSMSVAGSSKTSAGLPVVAPGASAPITVSVTDGGAAVAGAEVTLIAVDKAVLDLVPYALQVRLRHAD